MEQLPVLCYTTIAAGGYTAGSLQLNVGSTAAGSGLSPFPGSGVFTVEISDPTTSAPKLLLKVTGINSSTQFAVVCVVGTDVNCSAGDVVVGVIDARALLAIIAAMLPSPGPVLISRQIASGSPSSITFSSIPATYANLRLVITARGNTAALQTSIALQFNGDTGTNYGYDYVLEQVGVVSGGSASSTGNAFIANLTAANAAANVPAIAECLIPAYANTTFVKEIHTRGFSLNDTVVTGTRQIVYTANIWNSTAAINAIKLIVAAGNFVNGSIFELWGE